MNEVNADPFDDLDRLRLPAGPGGCLIDTSLKSSSVPLKSKRIDGEFLKGPIPLNWLTAASGLPGKAPLSVALAIWFQVGRRQSKTVKLTTETLDRFSVKRKAKYAGLIALEEAGLITVDRELRRNPVVTILDLPQIPTEEEAVLSEDGTTNDAFDVDKLRLKTAQNEANATILEGEIDVDSTKNANQCPIFEGAYPVELALNRRQTAWESPASRGLGRLVSGRPTEERNREVDERIIRRIRRQSQSQIHRFEGPGKRQTCQRKAGAAKEPCCDDPGD